MGEACGCIYVGDYDGPEFHTETFPIAWKTHRCSGCGRDILKGEKYEYATGRWDGGFSTYKTCDECLSIRDVFFCEGYYYNEVYNFLEEHIADMDGDISSDCLTKLTKRARDIVCDLIEGYWQKYDEE